MIASGWLVVQLRRVASSLCDGPFGSSLKSSHYADSGVRVIRLQNIGRGMFLNQNKAYISNDHFEALRGHEAIPGDLLVAALGDERRPVGRACRLPDAIPTALVKADCFRVRLDGTVDHGFVAYWLNSDVGARALAANAKGTTRSRISLEDLRSLKLLLPPFPTQTAIANFLDRKTAAIDALIEKKERLIALLAEKRAALIHRAVTKGLDPDVPMKDSRVPWIGEIPAHWKVKRLKYICRVESGHTPSRSVPDYWIEDECTIPWVSLNDTAMLAQSDFISDTYYQISDTGIRNSSAHLIEAGAVVFTRDATIGLSAITMMQAAVSQHLIAWVCGPTLYNRYLLRTTEAMTQELDSLTFGATIKTIGMADIRKLASPVPPVHEQVAIVERIDSEVESNGKLQGKISNQIDRLKEYRQALITAAVTGQLDIPEANP